MAGTTTVGTATVGTTTAQHLLKQNILQQQKVQQELVQQKYIKYMIFKKILVFHQIVKIVTNFAKIHKFLKVYKRDKILIHFWKKKHFLKENEVLMNRPQTTWGRSHKTLYARNSICGSVSKCVFNTGQ